MVYKNENHAFILCYCVIIALFRSSLKKMKGQSHKPREKHSGIQYVNISLKPVRGDTNAFYT